MEYIYSAMLLHSAGKDLTEDSVSKILKAAGVEVDSAKVKALVASLKDVNIKEAIEKAAVVQAAPAAAAAPAEAKKAAAEPEEEGKTEEEAAQGLSSLFG